MTYIHRKLEPVVREYLDYFPIVGLTGPRQSGKSTLLKKILSEYEYVTFDHANVRASFNNDPNRFLSRYNNKVIFDEVQKVPDIFDAVKTIIDQDRQNYGKYVLTSSSQFAFLKHVSESLAGRIGLLSLLPLQYLEVPKKNRYQSIYCGSFPELVLREYKFSKQWYSSYINTYLEKDVRAVRDIGNLLDFQRLITLLAANTSQILDLTHYANDIGVSVNTIKQWISVLTASYIIFLLPPFYKNFGKRITKRPKVYFYDTGMVSYLTGVSNQELYEQGPMAGGIFENYVIAEILKREKHADTDAQLYYLRTSNKEEVDLIVDRKTHKELIEIKHSGTFKDKMIENIEKFITKKDQGYLLYNGKTQAGYDNINILNYEDYLKEELSTE
ncbi:MAG: ATP-binding protein [Pseudomonadota bacterium]|nr:ATP-binding protein [Gammaproteobacteria bacterium]MBU1629320.1 ATP-binding protein [Gammaproteobacteria bacterium]